MKTLLLGGAAALAIGVGAFALDDDSQRTRVHLQQGSQIHMSSDHGTVVEVRGAGGARTVHVSNSDGDSRIEIDGRTIEIDGGDVMIDGREVASGGNVVVVVDGDEIRVLDDDHHARFETRHYAHIAERAEHAARMGEELAYRTMIDIDLDGLETEIMATLEAALADLPDDLEHSSYNHDSDWDDLTPEEQEEVREAVREAREEIREAMREVRVEIREAAREAHNARHVEVRVARELERAERDIARAERDMERAERRAERNAERAERRRERDERRMEMRYRMDDRAESDDVDSLRIETTDDGRRRIWVNGEEQTGDDLTDWLNRLESGRLDGGN